MRKNTALKPTSPQRERLRRIESRHNSLLKELRRAFQRGELTKDGYCAIEGLRIVEEAIRSGLRFRAVFFSEAAIAKAERLLPQIGAHVETLILPQKLFTEIVPSETPQGVAALVRWREVPLKILLEKAQAGPLLALAGVQDPGNLGTILRSAEAFGAAGVLLGDGTVNAFNSKVVRASAGSIFRLPVVQVKLAEVIPQLREHGFRLVATSSHKGLPLDRVEFSSAIVVFVGSEGAGVPREFIAQMDEVVAIPHAPQVESLNAGVAASILLYEMARHRK
jgi:RNA methyltransferase, TrmH family